jgi:hypothetical protein
LRTVVISLGWPSRVSLINCLLLLPTSCERWMLFMRTLSLRKAAR